MCVCVLLSDISDMIHQNSVLHSSLFAIQMNSFRYSLYEFYQKHILTCDTFVHSIKLKENDRQLANTVQRSFSLEQVLPSLYKATVEHNQWLIDLIKCLPYFSDLNDHDIATLIFYGQVVSMSFKYSQFVKQNEVYAVVGNGSFWLSRSNAEILAGKQVTDFVIENHQKIANLKLTERERALIYPYLLSRCDSKIHFRIDFYV